MFRRSDIEMRVLISAPVGRDAFLIAQTLTAAGIEAESCQSSESLISTLNQAAGAAILAEEMLSETSINQLVLWLASQPPWSDMPLLVLTFGGGRNALSVRRAQELQVLGNVTLLERPLRPNTLLIAVRAALRARMRQYEMRRQETLSRVNADLQQFAHSASHDLQEPLRNVAIYSELLSRRYSAVLDAQGQEFLNLLLSGALRMESLVRDLLVYTQAASIGEEVVDPIDANEPLAEALLNLREAIAESGAEGHSSSSPKREDWPGSSATGFSEPDRKCDQISRQRTTLHSHLCRKERLPRSLFSKGQWHRHQTGIPRADLRDV